MKKLVVVFILLMAFAGTVMGQVDLSKFPDPIEPGNFLVSIGAGIGGMGFIVSGGGYSTTLDSFAIGGLLKADYALPIPVTVGIEGGVIAATGFKNQGFDTKMTATMIPVLARVGWHPNFGVNGLDPYVAAKAGVGFLSAKVGAGLNTSSSDESGDESSSSSVSIADGEFCIGFGGDIGVRYFFTPMIGAFLEGNFDLFIPTGDSGGMNITLPVSSVVVGITLKF